MLGFQDESQQRQVFCFSIGLALAAQSVAELSSEIACSHCTLHTLATLYTLSLYSAASLCSLSLRSVHVDCTLHALRLLVVSGYRCNRQCARKPFQHYQLAATASSYSELWRATRVACHSSGHIAENWLVAEGHWQIVSSCMSRVLVLLQSPSCHWRERRCWTLLHCTRWCLTAALRRIESV